jgi:hypothetical protein
MPTLNWLGKVKALNHRSVVPLRVLEHRYAYGEPDSGSMIVRGESFDALKALPLRLVDLAPLIKAAPGETLGFE